MELFPTIVDDNEVRYCFILPSSASTRTQDELLEEARQQCSVILAYAAQQTHGFIWHKHRFHLDVVLTSSNRPILSGRTNVGDAIQDEWVIAKLVFDITRTFPGVVGRVFDSDGEFLLIESAEALPDWVTPETSDRRTFVVDGKLHLAPLTADTIQRKDAQFYDEDALVQVLDLQVKTEASGSIQRLIYRKLDQIPTYMHDNIHRVRCLLPEKVATIISSNHELVGAAVEAFYYREPKEAGAIWKNMTFLQSGDAVVEIQIKFSRAQYAQLKQQRFYPPKAFLQFSTRYGILEAKHQETIHPDNQAADLGMKLACGLELLYAGDSQDQFQCPWKTVIQKLLHQARDTEKFADLHIGPDDDDSWLYLHPDTLEQKLQRVAETDEKAASGVDELHNMASVFRKFVQGVSDIEGVEGYEPVHFDPDAFMKLLSANETSGRGADLSAPWGEHFMDEDESSQSDSDDESALDDVMAEMEAELAGTKVTQSFEHLSMKDTHQNISTCQKESIEVDAPSNSSIKPLDLDFNLVSNLLESLASQEGHAGPVSNILSQMDFPSS
ncbi:MADS box transcription factor [Plasmopara halstedii]|uniref:MADS box transcription factor n=1 Tax=Plasmopara halstedii TaxID=4781 RepID=A0A0P1A7C6_PLAHL|nr:MADS box transcription factor [Plasmopara halstedii]CEG36525.1 MADS box transcription factor [Plasmopara halstedii]|eukprot:XP_024572894.1 MADS box transcription factor [Plasmopara halstedii]